MNLFTASTNLAALTVLLTLNLTAAELTPKLLRLIGPDATVIMGADIEHYGSSELRKLFPWDLPAGVRQTLQIGQSPDSPSLTVYVGLPHPDPNTDADNFHLLDADIVAFGDDLALQTALLRSKASGDLGTTANEARRLSAAYDNWFLMIRPLETIRHDNSTSPSKYVTDLIAVVEQLSGGIRFGSIDQIELDVVTRNPSDAAHLAVLAEWLPGLMLTQSPEPRLRVLIETAEDLSIRTDGRTVHVSLTLSESRIHAALEALRETEADKVQ